MNQNRQLSIKKYSETYKTYWENKITKILNFESGYINNWQLLKKF